MRARLIVPILCAGALACYPSFSPLPIRRPAPDISYPDFRALDARFTECQAFNSAQAKRAYTSRKHKYLLGRFLATLGVAGGGTTVIVGDKSAKTAGGVIALASSFISVFLPGPGEDLENVDGDARQTDVAWGAARGALEATEMAARARMTHTATRPGQSSRPATAGQDQAAWDSAFAVWQAADDALMKAYTSQLSKVGESLTACNAMLAR